MVSSPDVDVVGRSIAAQAAQTLKRVTLELGGKTPLIVFEDMDVEEVAPIVVRALTLFNGLFCMSGSRVLVQELKADAYRAKLSELLEAVKVGPADDPSSQMGPLVDQASVDRVERFMAEAQSYSQICARRPDHRGSARPRGVFPPCASGAELSEHAARAAECLPPCSPVLSSKPLPTKTDALAKANATEYRLAAAVFTSDRGRAHRVAQGVKAGMVWTNTWGIIDDVFEEGGFKQSGVGRARGARRRGVPGDQDAHRADRPASRRSLSFRVWMSETRRRRSKREAVGFSTVHASTTRLSRASLRSAHAGAACAVVTNIC